MVGSDFEQKLMAQAREVGLEEGMAQKLQLPKAV